MSQNIPTTKQIAESNVANYENKLGQDAPIQSKAFVRVQSGVNAMNFTMLFKFGVDRAKQNLTTTATGDDLDLRGEAVDIIRKPAQPARLTAELPAVNDTIITIVRTFVGALNGVRYNLDAQVIAVGGIATLALTSQENGVAGNLQIGDSVTIDSPVPGAEEVALVTVVDQIGTNKELDDDYRVRILDKERSRGGGGNSSDYRNFAQEVAGVKRAYPFSGNPTDVLAASFPPQRTVYIQATTAVDPDGIAPQPLLDDVRDSINTDPTTLRSRQPLGLTDETLFVESIIRTDFFVSVRGLSVSPALETQVKDNILSALTLFFSSLETFVEGLDPNFSRNDLITDLIVSSVIEDVLRAGGASATGVGFGLSLGNFLASFRLAPGELAKLIQVTYE